MLLCRWKKKKKLQQRVGGKKKIQEKGIFFFFQILKNRVGGSVNQVIKKKRPYLLTKLVGHVEMEIVC